MRYKVKLSVRALLLICLLQAGIAVAAESTIKTVYIDGVKLGGGVGPAALSYTFTRLTIGAEGSAWYRYNEFAGKIDEFAVYGSILTDAQILAHKNAGTGGYVAAVLADNPLLYLHFQDANSDNNSVAFNSGSADVNGRYIDTVTLSAGYVGNAAEFSGAVAGAGGDCVDVPDEYLYLTLDNVTVEFWVQTNQASEYPRFFQHNNSDVNQNGYGGMYVAGTDAVGLIGGGDTDYVAVTPGNLNDGNWHHVVFTFASLQPLSYEAEVLADDPCAYLKFDNVELVDSSVNHYWAGYNWTQTRVQPVGGAMGGKALYVTQGSSTAAYTWNNGINPSPWRSAPLWDNKGDQYAFAFSDITFELWFKASESLPPHQYGMLFQQMGSSGSEPNAPGVGLYTDAGVRKLRVLAGSQWWYPGTNAPIDGDWHQLVVTYDENEIYEDGQFIEIAGDQMGIQLYLDGELVGSTTILDPNNHQALLGPELNHVMIGAINDRGYTWNCFAGYIDEFAIYGYILSPERVAMHYAAWQPKDCAEVLRRGLNYEGDFDKDCDVDLYDYAIFAQGWAQCNDPAGCP